MHAGHLKDLNTAQRERVLAFLLEKLHILQGKDASILGLARPRSRDIHLPDLIPPTPLPARAGPAINPITAALDPDGIHGPPKMPITPPPKTIMPFWGGYTAGAVLHERAPSDVPACMVSAGTQTADPELESADRLLDKVMQDVRPWGTRARSHPVVVQPRGARKGAAGAAGGTAGKPQSGAVPSRTGTAAVATPQGRLPKFSRGARGGASRAQISGGEAGAQEEGLGSRGDGAAGHEGLGDGAGERGDTAETGVGKGTSVNSRSGRMSPLPSHFVTATPPPPSLQTGERSGRSILDSVDWPPHIPS